MYILGISAFYHDSAACLIKDGDIIAAAQEVIDGHLIGPYAQLHEAVLTNADLTGVYLSFVNQTGATSTGVTGAAKYNTATMLPAGFDPVAAGWTLVS